MNSVKTSQTDFCCFFLPGESIRRLLVGHTQRLIIRWKGSDLIHAFYLGSIALLFSAKTQNMNQQ